MQLLPELDLRTQMAVLARTLWREGYDDHLAGHLTVRLDDDTLLCNPWFVLWCELRPEHMLRIDLDGNVLEGDLPAPPGIPLHLEFHRARPGVGCALHHHPRWGTTWANARRIPEIYDQSSALGGGTLTLVDEYAGPVDSPLNAADAVERMGSADCALLASHGVFVTGVNVRAVHQRAVALEHRCRMAWNVEAIDRGSAQPLRTDVVEFFRRSDGTGFLGFWEAMARQELAADPTLLEDH